MRATAETVMSDTAAFTPAGDTVIDCSLSKVFYCNVAFGLRPNRFKGNMDEPCSALDPIATR